MSSAQYLSFVENMWEPFLVVLRTSYMPSSPYSNVTNETIMPVLLALRLWRGGESGPSLQEQGCYNVFWPSCVMLAKRLSSFLYTHSLFADSSRQILQHTVLYQPYSMMFTSCLLALATTLAIARAQVYQGFNYGSAFTDGSAIHPDRL